MFNSQTLCIYIDTPSVSYNTRVCSIPRHCVYTLIHHLYHTTLGYVQFPDTVYIHWYTICIILHVYGYTLPPSSCIECLRICLVSWASRTKHLVFTYTELQNLLLFKYYQFDILILNWWALNCYLVCGYESLHASAPCSYVRCPTPADVTWHNAPDWLEHADR